MMMCFSFMISMAARCSDVCGWGQDSFPAGEMESRMSQSHTLDKLTYGSNKVSPINTHNTYTYISMQCGVVEAHAMWCGRGSCNVVW